MIRILEPRRRHLSHDLCPHQGTALYTRLHCNKGLHYAGANNFAHTVSLWNWCGLICLLLLCILLLYWGVQYTQCTDTIYFYLCCPAFNVKQCTMQYAMHITLDFAALHCYIHCPVVKLVIENWKTLVTCLIRCYLDSPDWGNILDLFFPNLLHLNFGKNKKNSTYRKDALSIIWQLNSNENKYE